MWHLADLLDNRPDATSAARRSSTSAELRALGVDELAEDEVLALRPLAERINVSATCAKRFRDAAHRLDAEGVIWYNMVPPGESPPRRGM